MVTFVAPPAPLHEPTRVMVERARTARKFQMYVAASLRVDERDPHLHTHMVTRESGIVYYQLEGGNVIAFLMMETHDGQWIRKTEYNPDRHPFKDGYYDN